MLAQNFKTPAELDLLDIQYESLVKVLGMLERGELQHFNMETLKTSKPIGDLFNMNWWSAKFDCGTVCCIGGTAEAVGKFSFDAFNMSKELYGLFYPGRVDGDKITTEQAAYALRSYLTTGEPNWADALAEP